LCTLVMLRRPGHDWPLIVAPTATRMIARPWLPPARHWPDRPGRRGGPRRAGRRLVARHQRFRRRRRRAQPDGLRSARRRDNARAASSCSRRFDHADARTAAEALAALEPKAYRTFNLIVATIAMPIGCVTPTRAAPCRSRSRPLAAGLSMIAAGDLDDDAETRACGITARFSPPPHHPIRTTTTGRTGSACCSTRAAARKTSRRAPCASSRRAASARCRARSSQCRRPSAT